MKKIYLLNILAAAYVVILSAPLYVASGQTLTPGGNYMIEAKEENWSEGLSIYSSEQVYGGIKFHKLPDNILKNWSISYYPGDTRLHVGSGTKGIVATFDHDGNMSIGTTTPPAGYMLAVKGKIVAREVKVTVNGLGDYIFSPAYRLRPLPEVEAFVKQNGHLPEVPSAGEVAKEGLNVGEMQNTLLKKIEELTLYAIEQNKKLESLQQENQQQAQQIEQLRTKEKNRR